MPKLLVPRVKVGHAQKFNSGCTVVLFDDGAITGTFVGGSAPGTRELAALEPGNLVKKANAIVMSGGSAFGLATADGVARFLRKQGQGYPTTQGPVPVVPAAVIFDLDVVGNNVEKYPNAELGYKACREATTCPAEGNVGVGAGATVGKVLGNEFSMKTGIGIAQDTFKIGQVIYNVSVIAVCNALGDVIKGRQILAGAYDRKSDCFLDSLEVTIAGECSALRSDTALVTVITDLPLNPDAAKKAAQVCQDGFALAISPAHTLFDGDCCFVCSTQQGCEVDPCVQTQFNALATQLVADALRRSATKATALGKIPAFRDVYKGGEPPRCK